MARTVAKQAATSFDRVAAVLAGLIIIGLVVFLLVRNEEIASPRLFFALRVVLSFGAAVLGATIPGFLQIGWSGPGFAIRAGGALALFVLIYLYTPDLVTAQNQVHVGQQMIIGGPNGVTAGTINGGNYTLGAPSVPSPSR